MRFTNVLINSSSTSFTLHVAAPIKLASTLVFLLDLNRVEPAPAAQNPAAPLTWPSRGLVEI